MYLEYTPVLEREIPLQELGRFSHMFCYIKHGSIQSECALQHWQALIMQYPCNHGASKCGWPRVRYAVKGSHKTVSHCLSCEHIRHLFPQSSGKRVHVDSCKLLVPVSCYWKSESNLLCDRSGHLSGSLFLSSFRKSHLQEGIALTSGQSQHSPTIAPLCCYRFSELPIGVLSDQ